MASNGTPTGSRSRPGTRPAAPRAPRRHDQRRHHRFQHRQRHLEHHRHQCQRRPGAVRRRQLHDITEDQTNRGDAASRLIASGRLSDYRRGYGRRHRHRRHRPGQQHGHLAVLDRQRHPGPTSAPSPTTLPCSLRSTDKLRFVPDGQNGTTGLRHLPGLGPDQRHPGNQGRCHHQRRHHRLQHGHRHSNITVTSVNDAPVLNARQQLHRPSPKIRPPTAATSSPRSSAAKVSRRRYGRGQRHRRHRA